MVEYREDDLTDVGYCPKCGQELSALSIGGTGFCSAHGWVFADWTAPKETDEEDEE